MVTKSEAVRKALAAAGGNPSPTAISDELKAKGISVTPNYVSNVKLSMGKRTKKKVASKKAKVKDTVSDIDRLIAVRKFVEANGGIDAVAQSLSDLKRVLG